MLIAARHPKLKDRSLSLDQAPSNGFSILQVLEGPPLAVGVKNKEIKKLENVHLLLHNPYINLRAFQKLYAIKDSNSQVAKIAKSALGEKMDGNKRGQLLVWVTLKEYLAKFRGTVIN